MDDQDGALSFDFEGGLDAGTANPTGTATVPLAPSDSSILAGSGGGPPTSSTVDPAAAAGNPMTRRSFRQTVCRHWLRSLCMKGDACGFLHQYDKARMPVCRFFRLYGECREQDCVYKHTNEDIKECNMYKLGFCPNGPDCRYRHAKIAGPPPPVEEVFQKIQQLSSFSSGPSNRFHQHRNVSYTPQSEKTQFQQGSMTVNPGATARPSTGDSATVQHQQSQNQVHQQQQAGQSQTQNLSNSLPNQINRSSASPLPRGQSRYFIVKSCNRENLELSVQKGIWATQRSNEAKLNEAFDTSENVILIFSINRTRNFQGCARMMSKTGGFGGGGWKYAHGTAHYGRNFSVKWLKLCELSFHKTRHLRNPYNENLPVKISRDCQELEPLIGEQLASLLYLEPDSELMAIAVAAETKREEEKTKGVNTVDAIENPDIVPFEENEEEDEEESDEEEESSGLSLGVMQARGRGRGGPVWPPSLLSRGGRSMPGMNPMGYHPFMMGPDAFGYGTVPTDGFPMSDVFGVAPRPFGPYGAPRFPGDFSGLGQSSGMSFPMEAGGPTSGIIFHGRPPQAGAIFQPNGVGMMMGAARGSFMGGLGVPPRVGRPIRLPFRAPHPPSVPHGSNGQGKREQRRSVTDKTSGSDRFPPGQEQSRAPDTSGPVDGIEPEPRYVPPSKGQLHDNFVVSSNFRHDESESEDEAPRRSRHGEGKKKRRDSGGGEASGGQWDMSATDQQS
ncbi:unnamed protein product [Victoria cruziana]